MTENEAIKAIEYDLEWHSKELQPKYKEVLRYAIQALEEIQQYRAIGTMEEVRMLKDFKELYDAYKLIGTIEEFRNLKYKKNVLPIVTIKISKEDMQKIVDEKVAQIELNIQEIRAKAIDEFAEALKEEYVFDSICRDDVSKYEYENKIDRIVKQMKEGI